MKISAERLSDEPILIITLGKDYMVGRDTPEYMKAIADNIGPDETGLYVIYDLREMKMSFGDLVFVMGNQMEKRPGLMTDPRLNTVVVGSTELVKLGIMAFEQEQYGKIKFPLFASIDEGLQYAREQIKQRK